MAYIAFSPASSPPVVHQENISSWPVRLDAEAAAGVAPAAGAVVAAIAGAVVAAGATVAAPAGAAVGAAAAVASADAAPWATMVWAAPAPVSLVGAAAAAGALVAAPPAGA